MRAPAPTDSLAASVLEGDPRALGRAITAIENRETLGRELLRQLFSHSGKATIIGVTGSPGAGKSTLVDRLAAAYRQRDKTIGIIAVDPSSPFSGGAILGDRIRMQSHHADPGIFIRSMATRGSLGGLAVATADAATVLDAAGRDLILVETVGVGQDEVDVVKLADATIVLLVPGMGDDVQTFKAGIMEIADVFVINKADRPGADRLEQEITAMLSISPRSDGWSLPIVKTVASDGSGVDELATAIDKYLEFTRSNDAARRSRERRWRDRLLALLRERLLEHVVRQKLSDGALDAYAAKVASREVDPYTVVDEVIRKAGL